MAFTAIEVKEMRDKLLLLAKSEEQIEQDKRDVLIQNANDWWETIKPAVPTTRQEALDVYIFIKEKIVVEKNRYRSIVLRKKLALANEKFMELKRG